ncbi:MAG TPA: LLM class flavin-dependent oxidoreductase [Acidimicrobiales bacterium]|jgi:alkanesulfonate monooxygenase SsuD/methylene tetrahydromethanopterin reductase-like flavin-dependent oxidoreductase (luciferase family)|nr:LLM class flavin-dependent oxidoreductase [Acidimicrobiales bacterium]
MDFYLFLPQMRMAMADIVRKAQAAEAAGFVGMAGMDHLAPPLAFQTPMYEAVVTSTWVAAHTDRLRMGTLVMCDAFRHPAVLAREAVSLDHVSNGRFDLGIGWGSVPDEFVTFGVGTTEARARVARLKETLEIVKLLWSGETFDYDGQFFTMKQAAQSPAPLGRIPIVIGGAGKKTMELVAAHADWWNVHTGIVDKIDEMRHLAGDARVSIQIQVAVVPTEAQREEVTATTRRRFGPTAVVGTTAELVEYFSALAERGVERVYPWFCDFARPETLAVFGADVISQLE